MKTTSLLYALPPLLFIASLLYAFVKGHAWRWAVLPAVLGCHAVAGLILWAGGQFRPVVRAELLALEADLEGRHGEPLRVTLGGSKGREGVPADTVLIPDYPAEAFEFRRDKKGGWHLAPGAGWRPGLVAWSGDLPLTQPGGLPALIPLSSGDRLLMPGSKEGKGREEWHYEEKQPWKREAMLRWKHQVWALPNRRIEIPMTGWKVPLFSRLPWRQQVYPLSDAGFHPYGLQSMILSGLKHEEPLGAHLLVMDDGLRVVGQKDKTPAWHLLVPGAALRLDEVLPAQGTRPMRLMTRRSFAALELCPRSPGGPAHVRLRLEKPGVISLPVSRIEKPAHGQVPRLLVHDVNEDSDSLPQIRFSHLTTAYDQANAELRYENRAWMVRDDYGDRPFAWGQTLSLGRGQRLLVKLEHIGVPWGLMMLLVAGAALSAAALLVMPAGIAAGAFFFGLTFLAVTRLLAAHAAWVNAPHDETVVGVAAQVIWLLPVLLAAAWSCAPILSRRMEGWMQQARAGWTYPSLLGLAFFLLGLRLALGVAGFKEALPLPGARMALSMIFVPAHLGLFALALCRLEADRVREDGSSLGAQWRFLSFIFLVFFPAQVLAGLFVSDLGTLLYMLPPALVLTAQGTGILWGEAQSLWQRRVGEVESRVMAMLGALLFMLPLAGIGAVVANPLQAVSVFPEVSQAIGNPEKVITESNVLRLMQFIDEKSLAELGTDEAQRIAQDHAIMRSYARRGLQGEGYLGVHLVHAKRETALNDNVFAVYGLAQFGTLGGLALIAAYGALMIGGCGTNKKCVFSRYLALMAALALGLTSLYMMGANAGLLPFTGRNLYLLGLNSLGDVIETGILVLLVVLGSGPGMKSSAPQS